jgi:hypothetical protein
VPAHAPWGIFEANVAHTCRIGLHFDMRVDPITGEFANGQIDPRNGSKLNSRLGYRLAFHHQVRDSLIVGISNNYKCSITKALISNGINYAQCTAGKNIDTVMGYAIYDGPTELDRVHFAGFYGRNHPLRSYAFMNFGAALKSTSHIARRISFDQSVSVSAKVEYFTPMPSCSMWSSQLIDEDGSITGIPNSYIIPEILNSYSAIYYPAQLRSGPFQWDKGFNLPPIGDKAKCTKLGTSYSYVCDEKVGLLLITAPALRSPIDAACVNYTRSDGLKMSDCQRDGHFPLHTSVRLNRENLSYGIETRTFLPTITLRLFEVIPGEFMMFQMQNVITASSKFEFRRNQSIFSNIPLHTSMGNLAASNSTGYFLNAAQKTATIKLVAQIYDYNRDIGIYRSTFRYNGVIQVRITRN